MDEKIIKHLFRDLFWLARLAYLVDIFNQLNLTLQGCEIDIFEATSKIASFKYVIQNL